MSAAATKKPSKTDWARIDALTDKQIDTSDIPPVTTGHFPNATLRLPQWQPDLRLHAVSNLVILEDPKHSEIEDHYYAIGFSEKDRLVTVCFVYRSGKIRIISNREATRREEQVYANKIRKAG